MTISALSPVPATIVVSKRHPAVRALGVNNGNRPRLISASDILYKCVPKKEPSCSPQRNEVFACNDPGAIGLEAYFSTEDDACFDSDSGNEYETQCESESSESGSYATASPLDCAPEPTAGVPIREGSTVTFAANLVTSTRYRPATTWWDKDEAYYSSADFSRFRREYRHALRAQHATRIAVLRSQRNELAPTGPLSSLVQFAVAYLVGNKKSLSEQPQQKTDADRNCEITRGNQYTSVLVDTMYLF